MWPGVLAVALILVLAGSAQAQPIRDAGRLLSCPDPSVVQSGLEGYRYQLVCTSDHAPNAFPIRGSNDLVHWHRLGYVFPAGHQPWWALHSPAGRYWAPAIYRIDNRWVVYFAAQFNAAAMPLRFPKGHYVAPGTFVLGVAWANRLSGPWHSRLLHYRGQFNRVNPIAEDTGGDIDPSMVSDPQTGQLFLFWAQQASSIWAGELSADGLTLGPSVRRVAAAQAGWECRTPTGRCVVEGPEETYRDGWFYLFFSGASTWTGTYAVGVDASPDPLTTPFKALRGIPDLQSGRRWIGPGGTSAPVVAPKGSEYIFYHVETRPNPDHISANRYLFASPLTWVGPSPAYPQIGNGFPG